MVNNRDKLEERMADPSYKENEYLNSVITCEEVHDFISKLKNGKSVGIDCIPNEVLNRQSLLNALTILFNKYFYTSKIPSVWLKAVIVPIPKSSSKDPCVPLNYRAISLLSCAYKTYSGILNNRLVTFFEDQQWFVDEQNGFRKGRSCQDHIFCLTSVIRNRFNQKLPTFSAFIDFQKAFDWIDRNLLFYKLLMNNVDGKMYKAIKTLYSGTESAVKVNNLMTDWFQCTSGVRQGDNLSTTLFSIFINDLAQDIKNLNAGIHLADYDLHLSILLYADDIVLMSDSEEKLQKMLICLNDWCCKWFMNVNIDKTKIVHFRPPQFKRTTYDFVIRIKMCRLLVNASTLGLS